MILRRQLPCLVWVFGLRAATESFILQSSSQKQVVRRQAPAAPRAAFFDDFEEFESGVNRNHNNNLDSENADAAIYAALKARQASLEQSSQRQSGSSSNSPHSSLEDPLLASWLEASTVPAVRIELDDWIRRMAIHTYPLMVCGSASGNLYLVDLQRGEELDCLLQLHAAQCPDDDDTHKEALQHLYGRFDGGGVVAIAMKDDMIASAGREGGVHICTLVGQEQRISKGSRGGVTRQPNLKLQRQGKIRGLELSEEASLVTSLAFDEDGTLWVGGYDGVLRGYDSEALDADNRPLMLRQKHPLCELDLESPILSLAINDEIGCGVVTTVHEGIFLFSLEDGEMIGGWNPFVSSAREEFARSALIFQSDPEGVWSVVIGGSRGSLFQRQLNVDRLGTVSLDHPFRDEVDEATFPLKMLPAHSGAVLAMDSPLPGILVTGAQDATMRVWDCSPDDEEEDVDDEEVEANYDDVQPNDSRPRCLYALSGYKVWLGSIFSSPRKLVSDGADNTIIVHSFDEEEEEDILFKEDDDEDFEGFSFE